MNALLLASVADRVASQLSRDAASWRPALVRSGAAQPIAVRFELAAPRPSYAAELLEALRLRVAAPYASLADDAGRRAGAAIVAASAERAADVTATLRFEEHEDEGPGLSYELHFVASPTAVRRGWLAMEDG